MTVDWEKLIASVPTATGVYIMKDAEGKVIYIGKAVNLRARVRSYFRDTGDMRPAVMFMHRRLADIEFVLTDSEKEALILENNLIKEHRPRYNIRLRDDKDYFCLRLTTKEKYPRLITLRRPKKTGEPTFGPYSSSTEMKKVLKMLSDVYPLRTCSPSVFRTRKRPCLNYEMGKCLGPCSLPVDPDEYAEMVVQIKAVLTGRADELLERLRADMVRASEDMRFEDAALYRDRIRAVETTVERQKMVRTGAPGRDVFGFARKGEEMTVSRMRFRDGRAVSVDGYQFKAPGRDDGEALDEFLRRLYDDMGDLPREVLVPMEFEGLTAIEEWLSDRAEMRVHVRTPRRGEGRELVELATRNATESMEAKISFSFDADKVLRSIARRLGMDESPRRIECVDISNISGRQAVGSLVRFTNAVPDKSGYRRYKIRGEEEPNDYAMMKEVIERRMKRGIEENDLPDLLIADGGKGQLKILQEVMSGLNAQPIALAAIAKDRYGVKGDRVFVPGRKNPVNLPAQAMHLLARIRDEAHRFAIEYHRQLRNKEAVASELTRIKGIGPSKRDALLKTFGSVKRVKEAYPDDLKDAKGITVSDAEAIYQYFHEDDAGAE